MGLGRFHPAARIVRPDAEGQGLLIGRQLLVARLGEDAQVFAGPSLHDLAHRDLSLPAGVQQAGQRCRVHLVVVPGAGQLLFGLVQLFFNGGQCIGVDAVPFQLHREPPLLILLAGNLLRQLLDFSLQRGQLEGGQPPGGDLGGVQTFLKPENVPPHRLPLLGDVFIGAARAQVDEKLVQLHSRA